MDPFFIIGAQRSGTTLLRLILNAHSKLAVPEEGTFWMPLIREQRKRFSESIGQKKLATDLQYIRQNDQFKAWQMDDDHFFDQMSAAVDLKLADLMSCFYSHYASLHHKTAWGDKTPSFFRMVPDLDALFPGSKFIHIVRDGRDAYLSLKVRRKGRNNISVAAYEWSYKIKTVREAFNTLGFDRCFEVRYESLAADPKSHTRSICDFLGVEFEPRMLEFWKDSGKFIGDHHSALIFQPVSSESIGRWKTELSDREVGDFEHISRKWLKEFDYPLRNAGSNLLHVVVAWLRLVTGIPLRLFQVVYTAVGLQLSARWGKPTSLAGGRQASDDS